MDSEQENVFWETIEIKACENNYAILINRRR